MFAQYFIFCRQTSDYFHFHPTSAKKWTMEEDIELFYDDLEEDFEEGLVRNFLEEEEEEI